MTGATVANNPPPLASLTAAQALAFVNALEREELAGAKPCPDLLQWVARMRERPDFLAWEAERWDTYDGDVWEAATLVEYGNGLLAVVPYGMGAKGVVMLADDRFHPVTGNPSADWSLTMGDGHAGFATMGEALMPIYGADEPGAVVAAVGPGLVAFDCTATEQNDGSGLMFSVEATGSANPDDDGMLAEYDTLAGALQAHPSLAAVEA